ncbi:uncharacterized protein LOC142616874 [Castanea sativa]|uniref:uncharacterized protein LOC142616874 n=1 Tax=Castanea sativa TaxID=21020 RepID=UPI003F65003C
MILAQSANDSQKQQYMLCGSVEQLKIWLIWNQRNLILCGGNLQDPGRLNVSASSLLAEYKDAQTQLAVLESNGHSQVWQPPEGTMDKLNFDAAVFAGMTASGIGVIIQNDRSQVMAVLSSKSQVVVDNEEAEVLVCRKALEFAVDAGFSELIVEGDNIKVMNSIKSAWVDLPCLGNLYDDIRCMAGCLRHVEFHSIRRSANGVAHFLACYARHLSEDIVWLEDSPPPALEALYLDSLSVSN